MKSVNVGQYKKDSRSHVVYLGQAKAKAIEFQHTENRNIRLLDIVFEVPLENQEPCEFLIRLETHSEEINMLQKKLNYAIENPVPHPSDNDLFEKAVIGMTGDELLKDHERKRKLD
jgi:hypothetical protein